MLGPFIVFLSLFLRATVNDYVHGLMERIVGVVQVSSSLCCVYASQALLVASRSLLDSEYAISGKFRVVQMGIMVLTVPSALLSLLNVRTEVDGIYSQEVMDQAWASTISIVLYALLSFGFVKCFDAETARNAMRNAQRASHTASLKSKTHIADLADHGAVGAECASLGDESDEMDVNESQQTEATSNQSMADDIGANYAVLHDIPKSIPWSRTCYIFC